MVAHGRVQNGVVVLQDDIRFPEGQEVIVLASSAPHLDTAKQSGGSHSILDIPTVSLGGILRPLDADDDLLGEMLEGRP
jgi:hypothetical protein